MKCCSIQSLTDGDEEVFGDEYFGCHPCVNTSSIRLRTEDVFGKYLEAVLHRFIKVKLT